MKARVKATGEIVEVHTCDDADFQDRKGNYYWEHQLYFGTLDDFDNDEPDYWTRLEHQAAIAAMQGILSNHNLYGSIIQMTQVSRVAIDYAQELVEKMKEEKE